MNVTKMPGRKNALASYFATEEGAKNLLDNAKNTNEVMTWLMLAAEADRAVDELELPYGEMLYNILHLPLEAQKPIVFAICDHNGVKHPSYATPAVGRVTTGRNELAHAIYGRWPDMLKKEGVNKDTRAAMRISDHVRRYKIKAKLVPPRVPREPGELTPRAVRPVFVALFDAAETKKEQEVLDTLFERIGFSQDDIMKWIADAKMQAADAHAAGRSSRRQALDKAREKTHAARPRKVAAHVAA